MRHKKAVAGAVTVLVLGVGATAVAAPGGHGPLGGVFGPDPQERRAEQARDLAKELKLPEDRVRRAIDRVGEKRQAEHRAEKAKELAKALGVSEAAATKALEKGRAALEKQFEGQRDRQRFRPRAAHGAFVKAIAEELDKSPAEVRRALNAARRAKLDAKLDEAVKEGRLTQKQADAIKKRAQQGGPMKFRFHRGGPPGRGFGPGEAGPRGQRRGGDFLLPAPPPPGGADELPAPPPGAPG
jgi:AraC-like DNA-binding protein